MLREGSIIKVLQVVGLLRSSGAARVAIDLSEVMACLGHEVALVSSEPWTVETKAMVPHDVEFISQRFPCYGPWSIFAPNIHFPVSSRFGYPDIVHFHGIYSPIHIRLARACEMLRIPYVVSVHGNAMREAQKHHRMKKLIANALFVRRFIKRAQAVHALGPEEAECISEMAPGSNIIVVPNGIKNDDLPKLTERDWDIAHLVFLFIGRLDVHHKGLDLLLEAVFRSSAAMRSRNASVWLVGPFQSSNDERFIRRVIKKLGLEGLVLLLGPKYGSEKQEILNKAHVFLHTSRYEGMPIAVLEAMASGIPILVTPGTNLAATVRNTGCGWVCAPEPDDIARALREIMSTDATSIALRGRRARSLAESLFTMECVARRMLELYNSILSGSKH